MIQTHQYHYYDRYVAFSKVNHLNMVQITVDSLYKFMSTVILLMFHH